MLPVDMGHERMNLMGEKDMNSGTTRLISESTEFQVKSDDF